MTNRDTQSFVYAPPIADSGADGLGGYSGYFRPLGYLPSLSAKLKKQVVSSVSLLLFLCCPPAVGWLIHAVTVDAIQRCAGEWPQSHIKDESLEGFDPSLAHGYPPPAVSGIPLPFRVIASRQHINPYPVLGDVRHAVSFATALCLSLPTSAACRVTATERCRRNIHYVATQALAAPHRASPLGLAGECHGFKSPETHPSDVFNCHPETITQMQSSCKVQATKAQVAAKPKPKAA